MWVSCSSRREGDSKGARAFVNSEVLEVCQFLSYDDVKKLMQSSEFIKTLLF